MSKTIPLLLFFIICAVLPATAAGTRPPDAWNYYHFGGRAFTAGPAADGSVFVALQDRMRPVILTSRTAQIEKTALPDEAGAVAGICYTQISGGKLGSANDFRPHPRTQLLISSGGTQPVTVQTDDHGYFVAVLPAGTYAVSSGPFRGEITVQRGRTTLVPVRAGKRMVD